MAAEYLGSREGGGSGVGDGDPERRQARAAIRLGTLPLLALLHRAVSPWPGLCPPVACGLRSHPCCAFSLVAVLLLLSLGGSFPRMQVLQELGEE